jgi:hypothetical protein
MVNSTFQVSAWEVESLLAPKSLTIHLWKRFLKTLTELTAEIRGVLENVFCNPLTVA